MLARMQARWLRWERRFSRAEWAARHLGFSVSRDEPHASGLLLIQIDGLSGEQLERAVRAGRMPFVRSLLRRRGYTSHVFYSGLPSTTPAVQAELYYGAPSAVPAFSFLDRRVDGIGMMTYPEWAKRIEADVATHGDGLLRGGSSWSNIYTGGATQEESHFCGASIGLGDLWRSVRWRILLPLAWLHAGVLLRMAGLLMLEMAIGVRDALSGVFRQGQNLRKELKFLLARVAVCIGLRELITIGAAIDVARGLPVVHVNFLGYDEQSHRRGPGSAFAHWTLRGIDRCVRDLYRAAYRSGRRTYDVWVFSDHGQMRARQAGQVVKGGLEGLVRQHWPAADTGQHATPGSGRAQIRPSPGLWLGGPRAARRAQHLQAASQLSVFEKEEFAVAALGPVGHIYFRREIGPDAARRLAAALVREGVPGVLIRRTDGGVDWLEAGGEHRLPEHGALLEGPPPLQAELARDLVALAHNQHAGDLVALGWAPGVRWTFAAENGAHAGPAPEEVQGFALLPPGTWLPPGTEHFIRPALLRRAALHLLGRDRAANRGTNRRGKLSPPAPTPSVPLRVATYNVHSCLGMDGRIAPQRIARVLEQLDADVVALQELDTGRPRSRHEDQVALIAKELGYHVQFCPVVPHGEGHYGHAILARYPLVFVQRGRLPAGRSPREPREALWVVLEVEGRRVHVVTTHLGLGIEERNRQVNALLNGSWLGRIQPADPVVLCGDLNLPPGTQAYRVLSAHLRDVQAHAPAHVAERTFPSFWPLSRLDHIFVSTHFEIRAVRAPRDALTMVASDHLPLVTDLDLRPV